jgi:hypothetical protein
MITAYQAIPASIDDLTPHQLQFRLQLPFSDDAYDASISPASRLQQVVIRRRS